VLGVLAVNLENGAEESKMCNREVRVANMDERAKPAFALEDLESGKIAINPGWLQEVWGKLPGDESTEELLTALVNESGTLTGKVDL
jgi:hypothetical protein